MKHLRSIVLSFLMSSIAIARPGEARLFPMGVWYEGGVGASRFDLIPEDPALASGQYDRDFADIAAHGVNVVVVPNTPPAHHRVLLDAAEKHRLKLIIELDFEGGELARMIRGQEPMNDQTIERTLHTKLGPVRSHPALWRVQLIDEPPIGTYERYAHIAGALQKFNPSTLAFSCLIEDAPVRPFLEATRSDVVAFDCYPIGAKTPIGDGPPLLKFDNVAAKAAAIASERGADCWAVIQCHAITNGHRFPTPAEIRCMTYLSLASGNKGVFWFLYQSEWLDKEKKHAMEGLVDWEYKPSDRWEEVAKLTKEIDLIAPTLQTLKPATVTIKCSENAIARILENAAGDRYVLAVNLDTLTPSRTITVRLDDNSEREIKLPAGGGSLLCVKKAQP